MRATTVVVCVVFAICCLIVPIDGQTPSESASKKQQKANNTVRPDNPRISLDEVKINAITVNQLNVPPQSETKGKAGNDSKQSQSYFQRLIAPETLPNAILCVFGAIGIAVAICTLRKLSTQTKAAKDSADAAKRTLIVTHRPQFAIGPIETKGFNGRRIGIQLSSGRIFVTNTGVLPAKIQKFWAEWHFWDVMPFENPAHAIDEGAVCSECPPGHFVTFPLPDYEVTSDVFSAINNRADIAGSGFPDDAGKLYLIGCLKYQDEIGLRRQYFAYNWEPRLGRFERVEHPVYNYEK